MNILAWKDAIIGACSIALVVIVVGLDRVTKRHRREELQKLQGGENRVTIIARCYCNGLVTFENGVTWSVDPASIVSQESLPETGEIKIVLAKISLTQ